MQVGRYLQLEAVADPVALLIITTSKATTHSIGSLPGLLSRQSWAALLRAVGSQL
jgi:hypothetical protein